MRCIYDSRTNHPVPAGQAGTFYPWCCKSYPAAHARGRQSIQHARDAVYPANGTSIASMRLFPTHPCN